MKKRILSLLLALCLVAGMLPTVAYAVYTNEGVINSNEFTEDVENLGEIHGGTFNGVVTNNPSGIIFGGTFKSTVNNLGGGNIEDGTFNGPVHNDNSIIHGGTFYGAVTNEGIGGAITGGTFYDAVTNEGIGGITGGTFYGAVTNECDIEAGTFYGTVTGSGTIRDSAKVTVTFNNDGSTVQEKKVLRGQKASAPTNPTKEDCTFVGWYNGETLYDFDTPVTENITLTAKWTASRIELKKAVLESYGYRLPSGNYYLGENISVDTTIWIGDGINAADVILDLNGYELKNDTNSYSLILIWCSTRGSTATLTLMDSSSAKTGKVISSSGDAITFDVNGKLNANGGTVEGNVCPNGGNAVIDNTDPSNVTVFREGQIYSSDSSAVINGGVFYSTVDNYRGQITGGTFYGTVNCNRISDSAKVTVTFNSDGGSTVDEQKVLRGQKASAPTAPTKAGYSFEGWYNGNTSFDFANTPVIENITLTAKWTPKTYHVTLNTNGADSCAELTEYTYGIGATLPTPVKAGYTFAGWYADSSFSGDAVTSISTTDTEDKTFYAKWYEKSDITFSTTPRSYTYDGTAQAFSITGTDVTGFDISYKQDGQAVATPTDAGAYDVIITRAEDDTYKAVDVTITNGLVINPKSVTATISAIQDATYTGSDVEPVVTVYDGQTVIPASEYTVSYSGNKNAGTATVTLSDKTGGNYIVTGTTTFEILPKSISDAVITLNGALTYNGTEQTQNVTVTLAGFDTVTFDVSGNKQTDVNASGDYTLTVTGNGNFTGSKNLDWNIAPATPTENPAKKTTASVVRGRTLADATVTNGEVLGVDGTTALTGTFAWVDSTKVMSADGTEQMTFTPDDTNYTPITIDVAVSTYTTGGGGSSIPTYAPTVTQPENGSVTVSPKAPKKGDTVTITTKPDAGYTMEQILVTDKNGAPVEVTNNGDGTYSFTQPADKVDITVTFMEDNTMLNFFVDVPADAYYYDAVLWAVENGITDGTSDAAFSPNAPCTRAQIVTFLWRAAGCPEPESMSSLSDVPADAYYAKAVAWALENGITTGSDNGTFSPNATCTRAQAMTFIYRSEQAQGGGMEGDWMFQNPFSDVDLENYYGEAIMWAVANGVTTGTSDTAFSPSADCTRAQIVTFLFRYLVE